MRIGIDEYLEPIIEKIDELIGDECYYNGKNLLRMAEGENPYTILISTTVRGIGKTSYYILISHFLYSMYHKLTLYMVRIGSDLNGYHHIFEDIYDYYGFTGEFTSKTIVKDALVCIFLNGEIYGYVAVLKKADTLKKFSSLFRDVEYCLMEEYQVEEGRILRKEPELMKSVLRTVGRGHGKVFREMLVVMLGNPVTLMNPHLIYHGIASRYQGEDGIIKNNRVAAEFLLDTEMKEILAQSSIGVNFNSDYDIGKSFLYVHEGDLRKAEGKTKYVMTIIYDDFFFGVRFALSSPNIYCVKGVDPNCKNIYVIRASDVGQKKILLSRRRDTWKMFRESFEVGCLSYETLKIKEIMFDLLGIDAYN